MRVADNGKIIARSFTTILLEIHIHFALNFLFLLLAA